MQLESCLKHIFAKYCTPKASAQKHGELLEPPEGAYLSPEGLDSWARDTNGAPFDDATKEELLEFMDVTDNGANIPNSLIALRVCRLTISAHSDATDSLVLDYDGYALTRSILTITASSHGIASVFLLSQAPLRILH